MDHGNHYDYKFKIATLRSPRDGEPRVQTLTIAEYLKKVRAVKQSQTPFTAYHFQKSELKRLSVEAKKAKDAGDMVHAKALSEQSGAYKRALENTKFGSAIMPFVFEDDITFKLNTKGFTQRDNSRITHFSLIMLDIESNTTTEEIHAALKDYEYVLWPTITHTPTDPRYRVTLFPAQPLTPEAAQRLIHRIDAHLPSKNDLSKRTQCIDPCSDEVGRLMFLPQWLINHPEQFFVTHNTGGLLTADSFPVSEAVQQTINERQAAIETQRKEQQAAIEAKFISAPESEQNPLIIRNGKKWINPDYWFQTTSGYVQMKSVTQHISGVTCPLHADAVGAEFLNLNNKSGRPQFKCKNCGLFKILPPSHHQEEEPVTELNLVLKSKKEPAVSNEQLAEIRERSRSYSAAESILEFETPELRRMNERFLPGIAASVPEQGALFVRSPKGTGKTEQIEQLVKSAQRAGLRIVLLTHRVSLANNLSARTGLVNYNNLPQGENAPWMVICVNSLESRIELSDTEAYDLVIIDESEQVFRNMLAETLKRNISDVFTKLIWLLQSAKQIVCLDADLTSEMTIEIIHMLRGDVAGDVYTGIINEYKIGVDATGKQHTIRMYESNGHLIADLMRAVDANEKVFVACSTAAAARTLAFAVESLDKRVLLVSRETSHTAEYQEFTAAPSDHVEKYDVVVASPSLQTGFSIDASEKYDPTGKTKQPYFKKVFGYFPHCNGQTYQDFDQAISRVRECTDVSVWIQPTKSEPNYYPPSYYTQRELGREMKSRKLLPTEPRFTEGERLWARLVGMIRYSVAVWSTYRDVQFKQLRTDLGYVVETIPNDDASAAEGRGIYNLFKDCGPNHAEEIFNAEVIDEEDALALQRKRKKSREEWLQVERWRIQNEFEDDLTLENIQAAIDQKLLYHLSRLKVLVLADDETRVQYDMNSRAKNPVAFTVVEHNVAQSRLIAHICMVADIDILDIFARLRDGEKVEISAATLEKLGEAFAKRAVDFNQQFNLRVKEPTSKEARPKIWRALFGNQFGLHLKKVRVRRKDFEGMVYYIDAADVSEIARSIEHYEDRAEKIALLKAKMGKAF